MHDNSIHDLSLAYWSELLSPLNAPAVKTNRANWESYCVCLKSNRNNLKALRSRRWQANHRTNHVRDCHRALKIRTPMLTERRPKKSPSGIGRTAASVQHFVRCCVKH
jgi:hypothetical protein